MRSTVSLLLVLVLASIAVARTTAKVETTSHVAALDGMRVHYTSSGSGHEALVFVHGWTCDSTFWDAQVPAFAERTRVLAIDLPGHGKSDAPKTTYSMDLFARAIDAVMRDAKVERAVLVGHSMGTPVVRQFARSYPSKTLALVVVDGALKPFMPRAVAESMLVPMRGPKYAEAAAGMIDQMTAPMKDPAARSAVKAKMLATPQHVAVSAFEGMSDDAIWKDDPIGVPVLAIMVKNPYYPADLEASYRTVAPDLEFQMWDGVSHFLMIDDAARFNATLAAFLAKRKLAGY